MTTAAELNTLTSKQLRTLGKETSVQGWHDMRKDELVSRLCAKSRSKSGGKIIADFLDNPAAKMPPPKKTAIARPADIPTAQAEIPVKSKKSTAAVVPAFHGKSALRRDISSTDNDFQQDKLALLVRDPYWLHAFWDVSKRTTERCKVALGPRWFTSIPILRLYQVETAGGVPRRQHIRDIPIHGGVNNWYIDVRNPPAKFLVELGYLTRDKNLHVTLTSNEVETPREQIADPVEKNLDGNWKDVADDLVRVYKLSSTESNNQELKDVLEKKLGRPITTQMLARYRVARSGSAPDRPRRNFRFEIDTDVIIRGKTDPNVQIAIRNEPIQTNPDGTFSVRFAFPDKRHMFPIEAEGSDGVEKQTVILTLERNTRTLETVIQEPTDDE